jgi:phosphate transport system substrate-binding protein
MGGAYRDPQGRTRDRGSCRRRRIGLSLRSPRVPSLAGLALVLALSSACAGASAVRMPSYEPHSVRVSRGAPYLTPSRAVRIVGYNDMQAIFAQWSRAFTATHRNVEFELVLKGTATAAPALAFGVSALAPMGAEFSPLELESYRAVTGEAPIAIRVAHATAKPGALSGPIHIFVNRGNPLSRLTLDQVAAIFSAGGPQGSVTTWGQLGLEGVWAERPIRIVSIGDEAPSGGGPFVRQHYFGGRPQVLDGYAHTGSADNVRRVAGDPFAIGMATDNVMADTVRLVAISTAGRRAALPSDAEIGNSTYPMSRDLLIYIRTLPDPLVREFLRLVLSKEGQAAVVGSSPGYVPLSADEVLAERAKLAGLAVSAGGAAVQPSSSPTRQVFASDWWRSVLIPAERHGPAFAFRFIMSSAVPLQALAVGASAFAPLEREPWPTETRPFRQLHGYEPTAIRIGWIPAGAQAKVPGFYVNGANPLSRLSLEEIGRVLTIGDRRGDVAYWSQLGLQGDWAGHAIHFYGPPDDGRAFTSFRVRHLNARPLNQRYETLADDQATAAAVANDRYGFAWLAAPPSTPGIRRLLVSPLPQPRASPAARVAEDPMATPVSIYVDLPPGAGVARDARVFVGFLLSKEGQAMIAARGREIGFVPLLPFEAAAELDKLIGSSPEGPGMPGRNPTTARETS